MAHAINLIGNTYGRLTVIKRATKAKSGRLRWQCQCECGNIALVQPENLKSGHTQSCGCLARERARDANITHGMKHTPEYHSWQGIIQRCTNPKTIGARYYYERGIQVCDEWLHSFETFLDYVGPRPSKKYTIDRIDNDGNYEPGNVRWATRKEQANNRRPPTYSPSEPQ